MEQVTELEISDKAITNATWLRWDRRLLSVTLRHLKVRRLQIIAICCGEGSIRAPLSQLYEEANPIIRTFANPSKFAHACG